MTLVDSTAILAYPASGLPQQSGDRNNLISASGERVAMSFLSPITGTLTGVGFVLAAVGTADDLDVQIEGLTAAGAPDGVIKGAAASPSVPVSVNYAPSPVITAGHHEVVFDNSLSVTRGDPLAVVFQFGGDTTASGNITFKSRGHDSLYLPGEWHRTGGSWTLDIQSLPAMVLNFNGTRVHQPWNGHSCWVSADISGNFQESGIKFEVAQPCRLCGLRGDFRQLTSTNNATFRLSVDGTDAPGEGTTVLVNDDLYAPTGNWDTIIYFSSAQNLEPGVTYRITMLGESSAYLLVYEYGSADALNAAKGTGLYHYTTGDAASPEDWQDEPTKILSWQLLLDQLDSGGGGGGLVMPRRQMLPI